MREVTKVVVGKVTLNGSGLGSFAVRTAVNSALHQVRRCVMPGEKGVEEAQKTKSLKERTLQAATLTT